ncbi:hypothetical protein FB558_7265 [Pseudonocardia kunmingensis]|uniref:Uncharacterized protein n=1 Tax=Pseudonocardia kunmingensis TaxID=630975 RepID=A0A543D4H7_9PSEU|nr:hypothetical protein FB558_7265 [Pseudonocardia kunmingensis]
MHAGPLRLPNDEKNGNDIVTVYTKGRVSNEVISATRP